LSFGEKRYQEGIGSIKKKGEALTREERSHASPQKSRPETSGGSNSTEQTKCTAERQFWKLGKELEIGPSAEKTGGFTLVGRKDATSLKNRGKKKEENLTEKKKN